MNVLWNYYMLQYFVKNLEALSKFQVKFYFSPLDWLHVDQEIETPFFVSIFADLKSKNGRFRYSHFLKKCARLLHKSVWEPKPITPLTNVLQS